MNEVTSTPVAVLNIPATDLLFIPFARGIVQSMTGQALLPNPSPTLAVVSANIDLYEKAQAQALRKTVGAATQRDSKRKKVTADLNHLRDYVQSVIETMSPEDAANLIVSVGMSIKKRTKRTKAAISARNGDNSGVVLLDAKALAAVAMYYWQFSSDQVSWTNVPEMMKASAVVSGLTPLKTYYFRFRATTRKTASDYSQVVSLLVL